MKTSIKYIKAHILPILFVIGGIIDQTTDLFIQLFAELGMSEKYILVFRIFVITFGAFKLYLSKPKNDKDAQSL
jgi:hypothetical protein